MAGSDGHIERIGLVIAHCQHTVLDGRGAVVGDGDEQRDQILVALEALILFWVELHGVGKGVAEVNRFAVELGVAFLVGSHKAHVNLLLGHVAVEVVDDAVRLRLHSGDRCTQMEAAVLVGHQTRSTDTHTHGVVFENLFTP